MKINFLKYSEEFVEKVGTYHDGSSHWESGYPRHSLMFFEGLVIYSFIKEYNIDYFIESGVRLGGSTSIWGRTLPDIDITCIDKNIHRNSKHFWNTTILEQLSPKHSNIEFVNDNSISLIPKLIENNPDKRIGIFIDGPKGNDALKLGKKALSYENVYFTSMHDLDISSNEERNVFSTTDYKELRKLVKSTEKLNKEHPQFNNHPRGFGLCTFYK